MKIDYSSDLQLLHEITNMVWRVLKNCYTIEDTKKAQLEFSNELGLIAEIASRSPDHISHYALDQVTGIIHLINAKNKLLKYAEVEE